MTETTVDITSLFGTIVTATATKLNRTIHYMFGHTTEIVARLQEMTNNPSVKNMKFPLVILFTDIPVTRNIIPGMYGRARVTIVIANITQQNYYAPQRLAENFIPILRPIKDELVSQIYRFSEFTFQTYPQYTEIERYFWGRQGLYGNQANMMNDYIDCIELQNLELDIKNTYCFTSTKNI